MARSGLDRAGRLAMRLASLFAPPYMSRFYLARITSRPFLDPSSVLEHPELSLGPHAFIADRVVIYQAEGGGSVTIGSRVHILRDSVLETGQGGCISIGEGTFLHPRAQVMAYLGNIAIGKHCTIAPGCAFYAYNHGIQPGQLIKEQPIESRGGIHVGDGVWLGFGVVVTDGVSIEDGAVVGAGSVVTRNVPANAVVAGNPARVIGHRDPEAEHADAGALGS